jgi:hypothetical protein
MVRYEVAANDRWARAESGVGIAHRSWPAPVGIEVVKKSQKTSRWRTLIIYWTGDYRFNIISLL